MRRHKADPERKCQKRAATHDAYSVAKSTEIAARRALEWIATLKAPLVFRYEISDLSLQQPHSPHHVVPMQLTFLLLCMPLYGRPASYCSSNLHMSVATFSVFSRDLILGERNEKFQI